MCVIIKSLPCFRFVIAVFKSMHVFIIVSFAITLYVLINFEGRRNSGRVRLLLIISILKKVELMNYF